MLRVPLLGTGPIFPVVDHAMLSANALWIAILIGILVGFGSGFLTMIVYFFVLYAALVLMAFGAWVEERTR